MLFEDYEKTNPIHSPVRTQYLHLKQQHPDAILFFRLGDFYETFDDDAETVARELEIALTRRDFGRGEKSPMAGVPHHAADGYIRRLVEKGYRVAVCEQTSDPALSKGLVDREVIRIVTPGTILDPAMLAAKRNNFLAGVVVGREAVGIAYVDITTGEFAVTQFSTPEPEIALQQEIARVGPAEVIIEAHFNPLGSRKRRWLAMTEKPLLKPGEEAVSSEEENLVPARRNGNPHAQVPELEDDDEEDIAPLARLLAGIAGHVTPYDARFFTEDDARRRLLSHFEVTSLEGFGCAHLPLAIRAAGAVLAYVQEAQKGLLHQLTALETYSTTEFMTLDPYTRRNLELFESGRSGSVKGSLLWVLDKTRSPMGGRLLRRWIGQPLLDIAMLQQRQSIIGELLAHTLLQAKLAEALKKTGDIERLINRVRQRIATPRDLVTLASGLLAAAAIRTCLSENTEQYEKSNETPLDGPSVGPDYIPSRPVEAQPRTQSVTGRNTFLAADLTDAVSSHAVALVSGTVQGSSSTSRPAPIYRPPAMDGTPRTFHALKRLFQRLANNEDIINLIEAAIVDEPPLNASEGGVIRPGYSPELDQMKHASHDGQKWIAELEQRERRRTGISNLKVGFNKVSGYYIEVTNSNLSRVPSDYIRKQTLTNGERYITPDLKEYEALILNAQDRTSKLEGELFAQLRANIAISGAEQILNTAHALAEIDVYLSLAEVAGQYNYCCPQLNDGDTIHIVAGRHPVVEQAQLEAPFIPNDCELSNHQAQILIITGPNMAGKSTYLRQVALITLMAQLGSYVPAEFASIGLVDRIFTRIGAQDDLATGQSTFMVEMVETANILHHATPRSLIILDEIGRGTSTYDGLAIARAVVEYLHNNKRCGARTLFATHYHELVEVATLLPRIQCLNIAVTEENGKVVFLRKIVPGGADKSYGIHVAQIAGIPRPVIHRAEEILAALEQQGDTKVRRKAMQDMLTPTVMQMTLFSSEQHPLIEEIKALAIDELTPIEAISKLYELQQKAKSITP